MSEKITCHACGGKGVVNPGGGLRCPLCLGAGVLVKKYSEQTLSGGLSEWVAPPVDNGPVQCMRCKGYGVIDPPEKGTVVCPVCGGGGVLPRQEKKNDENPFTYTQEELAAMNAQAARKLVGDLLELAVKSGAQVAENGDSTFTFNVAQLEQFARAAAELPALQDYASMYDAANWGLRERKVVSIIATAVRFIAVCDDGAIFQARDIEPDRSAWVECLPVPGTYAANKKGEQQ